MNGIVNGIDISQWQHPTSGTPIDWAAVKDAGVGFVIVKVTEAAVYVNPFYSADIVDATKAGLAVAGYLYLADQDGAMQADWYHTQVTNHLDGVMIDYEAPGLTWRILDDCANRLRSYGYVPMLYCSASTWTSLAALWSGLLAIADYEAAPANLPPFDMWQHSQTGTVPGIVGPVDLDIFSNIAAYNQFFGIQPAPTPDPILEDSMDYLLIASSTSTSGSVKQGVNYVRFANGGWLICATPADLAAWKATGIKTVEISGNALVTAGAPVQ